MDNINRKTTETSIKVSLDLKKNYQTKLIKTPLPFLNHMIEQISLHSNFFLKIEASGDIEVDFHHTVEDIGICLGKALNKAFKQMKNFNRYGCFTLAMEEALSTIAIDIRKSSHFQYRVCQNFYGLIGNFDCELIQEFFRALSLNAKINLHILLHYGENKHHMAESIFKCFAKALAMAIQSNNLTYMSSKEIL